MNVGPPLITNPQPSELVQPGQSSLHHPPVDTQPTPVLSEALGQHRTDPQRPQRPAMWSGVIGPVSLNLVWPLAGTPGFAAHWGNSLHQRQQLCDIVTISFRQNDRSA